MAAKYRTYGGERNYRYSESKMKINDSSFWQSARDFGPRGVLVTFEKPVTVTSFRGSCQK